jgi:hypothetical protein
MYAEKLMVLYVTELCQHKVSTDYYGKRTPLSDWCCTVDHNFNTYSRESKSDFW